MGGLFKKRPDPSIGSKFPHRSGASREALLNIGRELMKRKRFEVAVTRLNEIHPKMINMEPEKTGPLEEENDLPNHRNFRFYVSVRVA